MAYCCLLIGGRAQQHILRKTVQSQAACMQDWAGSHTGSAAVCSLGMINQRTTLRDWACHVYGTLQRQRMRLQALKAQCSSLAAACDAAGAQQQQALAGLQSEVTAAGEHRAAAEAAKAAAEGQLGGALAQIAATSQQLESLQGVADQLRKECRAAKAEVTSQLEPVHDVQALIVVVTVAAEWAKLCCALFWQQSWPVVLHTGFVILKHLH